LKRVSVITVITFLLLFSVTAFANTSNLTPVPDSNIQSSGWSNYIPAQGNGVSGAAIMQDNSTNQSLTRQWVYEGGYTTITGQVPVAQVVWVQSQEWVPPVTHQEWVPPVTHQVWVQPPGSYQLQNFQIIIREFAFKWDINKQSYVYDERGYITLGTINMNYQWTQTSSTYLFPNFINYPLPDPTSSQSLISFLNQIPRTVSYLPSQTNNTIPSYLINSTSLEGIYLPWSIQSSVSLPMYYGYYYIDIYANRSSYRAGAFYWTSQDWCGMAEFRLLPVYSWVQPQGYWQTVIDQPGYWKTVVDQPGYWKDTSHWETTTTYQTVRDVQYTDSPHWTEYEKIIPQYELKN
jgi:hypothetical protein